MSHLSITKASLTSALTFVIGQLVAFIPSFGPDKQNLISAGTAVISAVFLIANAIHAHGSVNVKEVEDHAIEVAKAELGKVDLNTLAANAVSGNLPNIPAVVRTEVGKLLSEMFNQPVVATTPEAPAPVAPDPVQVFPAPVDL